MSYDTPLSASGQQLTNLPLREQLRRGFKDMGTRSFSSAKNFGLVGAIFAGTECCIEGVSTVEWIFAGYKMLTRQRTTVSRKERPEERHCCWMYNRRCSRSKSWTTGGSYWMCGLRRIQRRHRHIHEIGRLKEENGFGYDSE